MRVLVGFQTMHSMAAKVAIHPYFLKFADLSRKYSYPRPFRLRDIILMRLGYRLLYARCLHLFLET